MLDEEMEGKRSQGVFRFIIHNFCIIFRRLEDGNLPAMSISCTLNTMNVALSKFVPLSWLLALIIHVAAFAESSASRSSSILLSTGFRRTVSTFASNFFLSHHIMRSYQRTLSTSCDLGSWDSAFFLFSSFRPSSMFDDGAKTRERLATIIRLFYFAKRALSRQE